MTVQDALKESHLPTADAEILLAHALKAERTWLLAHATDEVDQAAIAAFLEMSARRKKNEPIGYLTGRQEFYGRVFEVNPSVLIPRPATEGLVELALEVLRTGKDDVRKIDEGIIGVARCFGPVSDVRTIVDIGTGSGVIAVTIALARPELRIIGTDVSAEAILVATSNGKKHGCNIEWRTGDLLDPIRDLREPFLIVSNPPYVQSGKILMPDVKDYEPSIALFGGEDGGEILKKLLYQAKNNPSCRGVVAECLAEHAVYFDRSA